MDSKVNQLIMILTKNIIPKLMQGNPGKKELLL
jgi:hypothetical protein